MNRMNGMLVTGQVVWPVARKFVAVQGALLLLVPLIAGHGHRLLAQQAAVPPSTTALVFDGVTVVDVAQGKLRPHQRVVIVGPRIVAIGAARRVKVPSGAQVVPARGKYLIPGLWDLHMHTMLGGLRDLTPQVYQDFPRLYQLLLANGMTGFRDPATILPLDSLMRWRREILAGTRVGPPRQVFSGPEINGPTPGCTRSLPWSSAVCVADTADARQLVTELKAAGVDMLKMYGLSAEMYFVIAAEARRVGIMFGGHTTNVAPLMAADSGMSIADHSAVPNITGLFDSLCFHPRKATVAGCRPIAERWRQTNSWSVPTLLITYPGGPYRLPHSIAQLQDTAVMAFWRGFPYRATWHPHPAPFPLEGDSLAQFPLPSLRAAAQAGLPIALGTDALTERAGFDLHAEMALLVERGLTPVAALQAATLNPAKMLRATDSLGTVAPGKLADLVLLDANPLANITNTTTIRAVVANGRYFDRAALDRLLADVQAAVREKP